MLTIKQSLGLGTIPVILFSWLVDMSVITSSSHKGALTAAGIAKRVAILLLLLSALGVGLFFIGLKSFNQYQ